MDERRLVGYIAFYCNLALASRCCLDGSRMHSEDMIMGGYCLCKHEVTGLELEDDKYLRIALHYYVAQHLRCGYSDVFFKHWLLCWYSRIQIHSRHMISPFPCPCVTASRHM